MSLKAVTFMLCFALIFGLLSCRPTLDEGKTTLEFWTISLSPTYDRYIKGVIGEFEKLNPSLKVEWLDLPINLVMQKLLSAIAGGIPPDVVNLNSEYALLLAQNNALYSMDKAIPPQVKESYFSGLWQGAAWQGESYALPWYTSCPVVMYNKQLFKQAGLSAARAPQTWEEVSAVARAIKQKTGSYGFMPAIKLTNDWQMEGIKVVDFEQKKARFNSPEAVAKLSWYVDLRQADLIPPETLTEGYQGALDRYQAGKLGLLLTGPQFLLRIKKNAPQVYQNTWVSAYPLGKAKIIPAATMNLSVPRQSEKVKEAVNFILFLTNSKNQLAFCKLVPLLPTRKEVAKDEFFKKASGSPLEDEAIKISIEQLKIARDLTLSLPDSGRLLRVLKEKVEAAFYGSLSPKEALNQAALEWEKALGEKE